MSDHGAEIAAGERFAFGENWAKFLRLIDEPRIRQAAAALQESLGTSSLAGLTFLDVGCGSGLFSLAAYRLGATVHSFDYDPQSVACTQELKRRYCTGEARWVAESGSILDVGYLSRVRPADIVYSWGVLHHTGRMWQALANVMPLVRPGGTLCVAIYNDQGGQSRRWAMLKKWYNRMPKWLRPAYAAVILGPREARMMAAHLLRGDPIGYFRNISGYSRSSVRGMSYWRDLVDWIGGYPFEVAKPEEVFDFYRRRGFELRRLRTSGGGVACNEFVFAAPSGIARC